MNSRRDAPGMAVQDILIDQLKDEVELDVILNEFWGA